MLKTHSTGCVGDNLTIIRGRGVKLCCIVAGSDTRSPRLQIIIHQENFLKKEEREGGGAAEDPKYRQKRQGEDGRGHVLQAQQVLSPCDAGHQPLPCHRDQEDHEPREETGRGWRQVLHECPRAELAEEWQACDQRHQPIMFLLWLVKTQKVLCDVPPGLEPRDAAHSRPLLHVRQRGHGQQGPRPRQQCQQEELRVRLSRHASEQGDNLEGL